MKKWQYILRQEVGNGIEIIHIGVIFSQEAPHGKLKCRYPNTRNIMIKELEEDGQGIKFTYIRQYHI